MATESNDDKKFKQCIQAVINAVSDTINSSKGQSNSSQLLSDLRKKIKTVLEKSLSSLSPQCRNYLLNVLYQYHYNDKDKTLSNSFTKEMLTSFLHDLQGRLESLAVFQGAWNGDQAVVEEFIENYPHLKDKSGLYETTLLYCAARNSHFDLVQYLIEEAGCSVNAQNEEYLEKGQEASTTKATIGSTPLHAACYQGHLQIVTYLISHGADYYILNNANETPVQNAKSKSDIRQFFKDFLVFGYSTNSSNLPKRKILYEIEVNEELVTDCIWEYKPVAMEQWIPYASDPSDQLQASLTNKPFKMLIRLRTGRDVCYTAIAQFLRLGKSADQIENPAWIRCRGSSLLNFQCYAQWQLMFTQHPTGTANSSSSIDVFEMTSDDDIQLNSWYTADNRTNFIFETAMNYRRKRVNINLPFLNDEKITFNLESFSFTNAEHTIVGFIRWVPKLISDMTDLTPVDNFQLSNDSKVILLTTSCIKQAHDNDDLDQYQLKYENAFEHDDLEFSNKVRLLI